MSCYIEQADFKFDILAALPSEVLEIPLCNNCSPKKLLWGEVLGTEPRALHVSAKHSATTLHPQPTGSSLLLSYFATSLERRKAVSLQTMQSCVPVVIPENVILSVCPLHDAAIIDIAIPRMKTVQEKQRARVRIQTHPMPVPCSMSSESLGLL